MIEIIVELLLDFIAQLLLQLPFELGLNAFTRSVKKLPHGNAILSGMVYALLGALSGFLSLFIFPYHFTPNMFLRILNLIAVPPVVGFLMAKFGRFMWKRHNKEPQGLEKFGYGYTFALTMALTRFFLAK